MRKYSVSASAYMSGHLSFLYMRSRSALRTVISGSRDTGLMIMIMDIIGCLVIGLNHPRSASFGRPVTGVMLAGPMAGTPVIGGHISASMAVSTTDVDITVRALPAVIG